ncbi:MAG: 2-oxoglutarate ferredoxin oxidoreductase subunit beta [Ignavibacteria bacterium]|nr:MAG: 2-oxoglutarate ferredoxin oxidoreductase subunit beta [Ignavibacteria bacterium]KAF0161138.1 MAG: 2-oxoglutarate ferredoxin oxidoreductase subunit beta [Ignavibacteria bacterium]
MENRIDQVQEVKYTAKDFSSGIDVKWCPGCGDYSVLAQVQKTSPDFGEKRENIVWVSGIGCSSRFPYYMNTYGFHGIHGRAAAIATGVKLANPKLQVWVATGDGDMMSIGGNHFIHACRKNINMKIVMFNNKIYGLTKGQYSPTSERGKHTKSSPYGTVDWPFNPIKVATGSGASFVARSLDRDPKHMQEIITRAAHHKGIAFVEIYQNCPIFNDGAYFPLTEKETKADNIILLEHNKPLVFGANKDKGVKLDGLNPVIIDLNDGVHSINDCWVHDEFDDNPTRVFLLARFTDIPGFPTPVGVFRQFNKATYDIDYVKQIEDVKQKQGEGTYEKLMFKTGTWEVN